MSEQLYFVSKGRTIRGPITNRKKFQKDGKIVFSGESGKVYRSHDDDGNPIALPSGFVEFAKNKKETNGETLLQNLIDDGSIVLAAGAAAPVSFAKAFAADLFATGKGLIGTEQNPDAPKEGK